MLGGPADLVIIIVPIYMGNLYRPCGSSSPPRSRQVLGGPEDLFTTILYGDMFSAHFDMKVGGRGRVCHYVLVFI